MDRGKRVIKRSTPVHAKGIPVGTIAAPANPHDSPLLAETLDAAAEALRKLPERASVHLDRGYDSNVTLQRRSKALSRVRQRITLLAVSLAHEAYGIQAQPL